MPARPVSDKLPFMLTLSVTIVAASVLIALQGKPAASRQTTVDIVNESFHIDGKPTYAGRTFRGMNLEGLLMNARLVQATFDDLNPQTRARWDYPDGPWDPDRNVREFIEALPSYRAHGLLGFTINFQGGSPQGYSKDQPWINSAFEFDTGALRPDYMQRIAAVLDTADRLGMVPIVGLFYFGQEPRFRDEAAILAATDNAIDFLLARGYRNVLIEIANECDVGLYKHAIIKPGRVVELIRRVKQRSEGKVRNAAGRFYVSVSFSGGKIPSEQVIGECDFILLHGNGVGDPARIAEMVDRVRAARNYRGQPILFNEDDHFDFDKPNNHMLAAVSRRAGWGYFDYRMKDEGFDEGFQSVPVNWRISSARKRGFFTLLREMTGS